MIANISSLTDFYIMKDFVQNSFYKHVKSMFPNNNHLCKPTRISLDFVCKTFGDPSPRPAQTSNLHVFLHEVRGGYSAKFRCESEFVMSSFIYYGRFHPKQYKHIESMVSLHHLCKPWFFATCNITSREIRSLGRSK